MLNLKTATAYVRRTIPGVAIVGAAFDCRDNMGRPAVRVVFRTIGRRARVFSMVVWVEIGIGRKPFLYGEW